MTRLSVLGRLDNLAGDTRIVDRQLIGWHEKYGRAPTLRELLREVLRERLATERLATERRK